MATDLLLAWLGTMNIGAIYMGMARANNAKSRAVACAVAFVFGLAFIFSSYNVIIGDTAEAQQFPVIAWLGVGLSMAAFVLLLKAGFEIIEESSPTNRSKVP